MTGQKASGGRIGGMAASLRGYWTQAESYQKFLYSVGFLLVASAVFHLGVLLVTRGTWQGDVSWRKPILFGESFGLTAISVAWIMTFLPKRRILGWLLAIVLGLANAEEVLWVSLQQWRGVASHFNNTTPFDAALFALAGIAILFAGGVILFVTLWTFFSLRAPPSVAWAIRVGTLLLLAGQVFGFMMIRANGHTFGAAGAMRVPHALALHGAQFLPALAVLLLFTGWSETRRTRTVVFGAAGYCILVAAGAFQTFSGRDPLDLSLSAALVLGVGALLLVWAYVLALSGVRQAQLQAGTAGTGS